MEVRLQFADTAGIRDEATGVESAGIRLARTRLADADCRLLVLDLGDAPQADDERLMSEWPDALIAANKCDLPDRWASRLPAGVVRVSARTGDGT